MEVIINKSKSCSFNEVKLSGTFLTDDDVLMMRISEQTAICLSDGEVYFFKSNEMCRLKDCVIVEREIFEHLKQEADHYE